MAITPIGPRVLIKPYKQEEKTKGGIYIPDSAKEKKKQGEVIAVGTFEDGKELPSSRRYHSLWWIQPGRD
jgi:chaperonin GroES